MPHVTVELTDEEDALVERLVRSGRYASRSAVVIDASHLLEEDAASKDSHVDDENERASFVAAIQVGLDDLKAGRYVEFTSADELATYLHTRSEQLLGRHGSS